MAGVTALYHRERDIALAAYDGDAAAGARYRRWRDAIHGANAATVAEFLRSEAEALYDTWRATRQQCASRRRDRPAAEPLALAGSATNEAQPGTISAMRSGGSASGRAGRRSSRRRSRPIARRWRNARASGFRSTGRRRRTISALRSWTLGERESGTARLEEAVAAYRAALEERTRERVPLDWATTQNNLGNALSRLGERESGTARLEEAVAAYRAALEERTRERVPLDWATTQNNLGMRSTRLGERESGTARLEEAVAAYRAALEERTRERVPLDWAATQNNLGNALAMLGERESGTARLEEAVAAYRAALEERTRERVPLDWAMTQNNLGNALSSARRAGERDGAARGGGRGLSRGAGGKDARAGSARLGDDAEQSRQCALRRSASGRAGRRSSRRRSRPIARRWRN